MKPTSIIKKLHLSFLVHEKQHNLAQIYILRLHRDPNSYARLPLWPRQTLQVTAIKGNYIKNRNSKQ